MSSNMKRYIGLDVHKEATSIAIVNGVEKLVMESIVETSSHSTGVPSAVVFRSTLLHIFDS